MNLSPYFKMAIEQSASDLHLIEGSIPALRVAGELVRIAEEKIPFGELRYSIFNILDKTTITKFIKKKEIDFAIEFFENNFRVNLHLQKGKIALNARLIPRHIPKPDDIGFTEDMYNFTHLKDGLIIITGPSGTGKSTTLAAMLGIINQERRSHIITIEDPIEYRFTDKQSIVEQRQIGRDTDNFSVALRSALRQDPNVIMVGEMRDRETVEAVLTAAKTGHLVLSTLHTSSAAETIRRIIDYFPGDMHSSIGGEIASVLRVVISQQLLPRVGGGLVAAREILINNTAISNLIRTGQAEQIQSVIQTNIKSGMITMNRSIENLYKQNLISGDVARNRKRDFGTMSSYY